MTITAASNQPEERCIPDLIRADTREYSFFIVILNIVDNLSLFDTAGHTLYEYVRLIRALNILRSVGMPSKKLYEVCEAAFN